MSVITEHRPAGHAETVFWGGWSARLDQPLRILPEASVSVAWGDDGRIRLYGPHTRSWWTDLPQGCNVVWTAIQPGLAAMVPDVREVRDAELDLDAVLSAATYRRFVDVVGRETSAAARIAVLQQEVLRFGGHRKPDPVVGRVVSTLRTNTAVSAATLAAGEGLSVRQLYRRCNRALGVGPSTLRRLLRLERFLRLACSRAPCTGIAELAAGSGYADQQHLTHECRDLTGHTPSELLRCA